MKMLSIDDYKDQFYSNIYYILILKHQYSSFVLII